jgi:hypothetical protein
MHVRLAGVSKVVASRLIILLARDFLFFRACSIGLLKLSAGMWELPGFQFPVTPFLRSWDDSGTNLIVLVSIG